MPNVTPDASKRVNLTGARLLGPYGLNLFELTAAADVHKAAPEGTKSGESAGAGIKVGSKPGLKPAGNTITLGTKTGVKIGVKTGTKPVPGIVGE